MLQNFQKSEDSFPLPLGSQDREPPAEPSARHVPAPYSDDPYVVTRYAAIAAAVATSGFIRDTCPSSSRCPIRSLGSKSSGINSCSPYDISNNEFGKARIQNYILLLVDIMNEKKKIKGTLAAEETNSPRKSLKIRFKQQKPSTTTPPPPSDDRERDEINEATQLSLVLHKTAKVFKEHENVAVVKQHMLHEDIEKLKKDDKTDDADDHTDHASIKTRRTGSLEIKTEKMLTPIPSPLRSPRKDLSSDKAIDQELTIFVTPTPATSTQDYLKPTFSKRIILPRKMMPFAKAIMMTNKGMMLLLRERKVRKDKRHLKAQIDEDEVIPEDEASKVINEFQNVDKQVTTIFDHERMEEKLRDILSNQFRNAKEYAYHLEQSQNYLENQIVWESNTLTGSVPGQMEFHGTKDNIVAGQAEKKKEPEQEYILISICTTDPLISQGPKDSAVVAGKKATEVDESRVSDNGWTG
nr:hypothetical protein [Tanacetum cinerariifolium]